MLKASPIRFGILGGSSIAKRAVIPAMQAVPGMQAAVVGSRSDERRGEFRSKFGIWTVASYEEVLADPEVDAVYISLPNSLHGEWTLRSLAAGKHVYCDKPAVLDAAAAERVAAEARSRKLVFLEGYMHHFHPQHREVEKMIQEGAIGTPIHFDAWYGFPPFEKENIRMRPELGGGVFYDAAGYPVSTARRFFGEPVRVSGSMHKDDPAGVDVRGTMRMEFREGRTAQAAWGFGIGYRNAYSLWGTDGGLTVDRVFSVPTGHIPTIVLRDRTGAERTRKLASADQFREMLVEFARAVRGERPFDAFLSDFVAVARILHAIRFSADPRRED